jgi:hypothetical protein
MTAARAPHLVTYVGPCCGPPHLRRTARPPCPHGCPAAPGREGSAPRGLSGQPLRRVAQPPRTRRSDASSALRAAPKVRLTARSDPCAVVPRGSPGRRECACADGSRASWLGAGCSAGRCASTRRAPEGRFTSPPRWRTSSATLDVDPAVMSLGRTTAALRRHASRSRRERLCNGTRRPAEGSNERSPGGVPPEPTRMHPYGGSAAATLRARCGRSASLALGHPPPRTPHPASRRIAKTCLLSAHSLWTTVWRTRERARLRHG